MQPDPEPVSAEHDEPWPGGRANHYLFDMNRDWFAQSQPETVGRTRLHLEWYPHVVVDLHEMGGDSTYYFAPPAIPVNPHITPRQRAWFDAFGKANAARFDERGFAYFVREVYDSFYPGYGESWPIFQGAIGMTYEQASARGLAYRRERRDAAQLSRRRRAPLHRGAHHRRDRRAQPRARSCATSSSTGDGRPGRGRGAAREYLLPPGGDPARAERLARSLMRAGRRGEARDGVGPRSARGRCRRARSSCPLAQPAGRLVRNLLEPHVAMDDEVRQGAGAAAAASGFRTRSTTSPPGACRSLYDVECVPSERATTGAQTSRGRSGSGDRRPPRCPPARVALLPALGRGRGARP